MADDNELMMQSLELAAEQCEDIAPLVYERFFALAPEARVFFAADELSQGRMLNEAIFLLLDQASGRGYVPTVANSMRSDHLAYGEITAAHYRLFFEALLGTLRTLLGESWSPACEAAWNRQADQLSGLFAPAAT